MVELLRAFFTGLFGARRGECCCTHLVNLFVSAGKLARRSVSFDGALYIIERDRGSAGSVMASRPLPITQPVRNMPSGR
jgi:hypothetical protein